LRTVRTARRESFVRVMLCVVRVLVPLPDHDFDVTEVAVPWKILDDELGHELVFATEHGATPACDPLLITGVVFGALGAKPDAIACYRLMEQTPRFVSPMKWDVVDVTAFDALLLAGGHAPGMKQYLGSERVQAITRAFFEAGKPVAAICHGVLVAARSGALSGRRTTCLPKYMERSAFLSTFWRRGRYYRTYPAYVEDEVKASGVTFERGPKVLFARGTRDDDSPAFVVEDGNYLSARWPGDAYLFAKKFADRLK
jgi:putative intracellular protease/amidase